LDFLRGLLRPALDSSTNLRTDNAQPFALAQLNTRLLLALIQWRLSQFAGMRDSARAVRFHKIKK
jgi:hypothetical protein